MSIQEDIRKAAIQAMLEDSLRVKAWTESIRKRRWPRPWPWPNKVGVNLLNPELVGEKIKVSEYMQHESTVLFIIPSQMTKSDREKLLKIIH
jgi:hypothetical protein